MSSAPRSTRSLPPPHFLHTNTHFWQPGHPGPSHSPRDFRALRSPWSLALFQGAQGTRVNQVIPNTLHTNNDLFYPGPPSNPGPSPPSHPHRHKLRSPGATRIFSLTPHMPKSNGRQSSGGMDHSNAKNLSAKATILFTKRPAFFEEK